MKPDLYTCLDIEKAILGTMIMSPKAAIYALDKISPGDFYRDSHRLIYSTMQQMTRENKPLDMLSLVEELKDNANLPKIGGSVAIASMCDQGFEPFIINHVKILKEKSERRQLRVALQKSIAALDEPEIETEEIFTTAQKDIYSVFERKATCKYRFMRDISLEYLDILEDRRKEKKGISWGFPGLDSTVGLIMPGRVYYVGARPAMGKTAFALTISQNIAKRGTPLYFASMEMMTEHIMDRNVSMTAGINGHTLQHGFLRDNDWGEIIKAANLLSGQWIAIDDERQTTSSLFLKARQFKAEMLEKVKDLREQGREQEARNIEKVNGVGVVVVDYLQQFKDPQQGLSLDQHTRLLSGAMVDLAKELNTAVICLTQLNRENEKSSTKRPQLSHLRGGGSQEQDAWAVLLLHREEYYNQNAEDGKVEVIVAKNRSGPTGTVNMRFRKEFTKFEMY